jgi:predicted nuclease of predicted toxin-antitoxin system
VKFKLDENLPDEAAGILRDAGFPADTVGDENLSGADDGTVASTSSLERRILVTLDLDFENIRAYPPGEHCGIIVLRVKHQDKLSILAHVRRPGPGAPASESDRRIMDRRCQADSLSHSN